MAGNSGTLRVLSIDAFRGITILTMIFVNEVAGVAGIPGWLKHAAADADAMTFVDIVFPAFLFIVGMSIPFSLQSRRAKGGGFWPLQAHIAWRTIGLLVMGLFMVNAEEGYNEAAMGFSIHAWSLYFYASAILLWNVYTFKKRIYALLLQVVGIAGLITLAMLYRGGTTGTERLTTHWWGILGLIGWAYFISAILYQLSQRRTTILFGCILLCILWYMAPHIKVVQHYSLLHWIAGQSGHAIHASIVLSGILLSQLFFGNARSKTNTQRYMQAIIFASTAAVIGFCTRPAYGISKIYATPSWAMLSVAICIFLFCGLYWLIDIKRAGSWTRPLRPAASNPLLVYILPAIVYHLQELFGLYWMPDSFHQGWLGVAWAFVYALIILWLAALLTKLRIRLHL